MTALVPAPAPAPAGPAVRRRAHADVTTADGMQISGSAARRLIDSVPRNSHDARASRWRTFTTWCGEHGWDATEPGAVLSHLADLADHGHPTGTLEAHFSTLRGLRQIGTSPPASTFTTPRITTVKVDDPATGRPVPVKALVIKLRRSKADQRARGHEIRILAPGDDELCPIWALEEWLEVFAADGQLAARPLLRRIDRHGNIGAKAADRHTKDPLRRGGITAETVSDLVTSTARAADLTPTPTAEEKAAATAAKQEAYAAAGAAPTAEEAGTILKAWRTAAWAARQAVRRITGHSMRRGCMQAMLGAGHPAEKVALHSRHSVSRSAFDVYREKKLTWAEATTRGVLDLAA
ncbi:integrase (plasmid) [Streptomyces clavuligerus]|uniref:Integrase family protein n=3 Tax=Streptomyces clavuligerus TaxID=1901 RepID=D5SI93_STRCL|nr:hypothetical protein [Streptomyces clavuligerus]EFG03636.1 Integrase family protein [Streptomyces clavuligerus]MBY6307802.1 integrase [Streptomyces clavuligerus]QCS09648.1 integrase [Streptomyces clavuligerus]QPJ98308.1 integrase [Streptomyces clavuligerus]WDN56366.1 integrase [Streptomyces clavuligerus]